MIIINPIARSFLPRTIAIQKEILEHTEDFKELALEMKSRGLSQDEIKSVQKAARRHFWDDKRREREELVGQYVLQLEAPLQEAAD
jgi:predicted transcriptional regulator